MKRNALIIDTNTISLFFISVAALLLILVAEHPVFHLFAVWAVVILAIWFVRADILHPFCWYSVSCALYNTAYSISYVLGYDQSAGYSRMNSIYALLALCVVLMIVGPQTARSRDSLSETDVREYHFNELTFFLFALLSVVAAIVLLRRGYTGKRQIQQANDPFYYMGVNVVRWMMMFLIILNVMDDGRDRRKLVRNLVVSAVAAFMMGLFTGERDIIFRDAVLVICLLFRLGIVKKRHFLILIPAGILLMAFSLYFKYYFMRGMGNTAVLSSGLLQQFLSSDFGAAGRNEQYMLNNDWTKGYFGIRLFFNELGRGILPFFRYINPSTWYNYEVFPGRFKGNAFTYVGFGYAIGGTYGVIFVHIVLGFVIRFVYRSSGKSMYATCFYIFFITIVTACFRQTINTVVNVSIKSALLAILLSSVISKFRWRRVRVRTGQSVHSVFSDIGVREDGANGAAPKRHE